MKLVGWIGFNTKGEFIADDDKVRLDKELEKFNSSDFIVMRCEIKVPEIEIKAIGKTLAVPEEDT